MKLKASEIFKNTFFAEHLWTIASVGDVSRESL